MGHIIRLQSCKRPSHPTTSEGEKGNAAWMNDENNASENFAVNYKQKTRSCEAEMTQCERLK